MKLKALLIEIEELRILAAQLPQGRIYASGLGFVPEVQKAFLDRLHELAQGKPAPGLPKSWDAIDVGHLVLARDNDGFYEAIVVTKDKDMLTVKFRNYPLADPQTVHRSAVGLLKPTV